MVCRNMDFDLNIPLGSEENVIEDTGVNTGDSENLNSDRLAVLENRLSPGSVIESMDSAYLLYSEYARLVGFSVRKGTQDYFRESSEIRMRSFLCHCEGEPDCKRSRDQLPSCKKQQQLKTGCQARLRIIREQEGPWRVSKLIKDHNHELVDPDQSYLLRSACNLTHSKAFVTEAIQADAIPSRNMEKDSAGVDNIGFTIEDAYDRMGRIKLQTRVPRDDANALYQYLSEKAQEPGFYWDGMMDDEGRLVNFFIRDGRSALDYDCFGDVMIVDTTIFETNRCDLMCATFEGINHHRCNVLFGIAFMSDETTRSFEWLFSTFLEAMRGKEPEVIFSDQCRALMNGIDYYFLSAHHRFCQWHVNQIASSHFGRLNNNQEFKRLWVQCMNGCETESEFEQLWESVIQTNELQDRSWFNTMYHLRRRWSSVFTNKRFSAGMHTISRSESANKVLKSLCKNSCSLHEVVLHYETLLKEWRQRDRAEDAYSMGSPGQFLKQNDILRHAATVYTRSVYRLFEAEVEQTVNVYITEQPSDISANDPCFKMTDVTAHTKVKTVCFNRADETAYCTCCMWETDGILCRHVLKVLHTLNISKLPERYILRRWTRAARNLSPNNVVTPSGEDSGQELLYVNNIMMLVHSMAQDCKDSAALRAILNERICGLYDEICGTGNVSPVLGKRTRNGPS
ncbi:hypothetical protein C2S51_003472 [Perilla frutescens var. frutescens]|nr:hypothetical protein C2S51_003472 [Perilla frutescens var. frutescens]